MVIQVSFIKLGDNDCVIRKQRFLLLFTFLPTFCAYKTQHGRHSKVYLRVAATRGKQSLSNVIVLFLLILATVWH